MLVTEKTEIEVGRKMQSQMESQYGGRRNDKAYRARIDKIMDRLLPYVKRTKIPYSATVVAGNVQGKPIVNAFACPGGPLFFTVPLLDVMKPDTDVQAGDEDATLAFVTAHEISHVELEHGRKSINNGLWRNIVAGAIQRQTGTELVNTAAQMGTQILFAKYSRKDESAADEAGIRLMGKAGYNMALAVRALDRLGGSKYKGLDKYLATHPATPDRMERARQLVRWLREDPNRLKNDIKFVLPKTEKKPQASRDATDDAPAPLSSPSTAILDDTEPTPPTPPPLSSKDQNSENQTPPEIRFTNPLLIVMQDKFSVVMAPLFDFAHWARAETKNDGDKILLRHHNFSATFTRHSRAAIINGQPVTMVMACEVFDGVLYAPLGNIADATGVKAALSADQKTVELRAGEKHVLVPLGNGS
jgi:hypothetical protein